MHEEAAEELRVRFKLAVIEIADRLVSQRLARNSLSLDQLFIAGKRNTKTKAAPV